MVGVLLWLGKFTLRLMGFVLMWTVGVVAVGCVAAIAVRHWYDGQVRQQQMTRMPAALHVTAMTYSNEISDGWGPGASETGLAAYDLPEGVATQISTQGRAFFDTPGPDGGASSGWRETPIIPDRDWTGAVWIAGEDWQYDRGTYRRHFMSIRHYLEEYGRPLENIPPDLEERINKAILEPGGYYAYGGGGSLLIVPAGARQVFLLFRK